MHGSILHNDADLLNTVREASIEEEELAMALAAKKTMIRSQKEKVTATKTEQKAVKDKEQEKAPEKASGGTGPASKDKYPD